MKKVLFGVLAAGVLGGCAIVDSSAPATEREEVIYRTGSNIPTRQKPSEVEGVKTYDKDAVERARHQNPPTPRPGSGPQPGG